MVKKTITDIYIFLIIYYIYISYLFINRSWTTEGHLHDNSNIGPDGYIHSDSWTDGLKNLPASVQRLRWRWSNSGSRGFWRPRTPGRGYRPGRSRKEEKTPDSTGLKELSSEDRPASSKWVNKGMMRGTSNARIMNKTQRNLYFLSFFEICRV